jgi:predicted MPP superfamily phosphohydrolase
MINYGVIRAVLALAAAGLAYARVEAVAYRLRRVEVPVLPAGASSLSLLHISDLHLHPKQHRVQSWVPALAELEPDLVINTGDNLAHRGAVAPTLRALGPLLELPGAFVLGSNDYYEPRFKNPARYLRPDDGRRIHGTELPWRQLRDAFVARGWQDLTNSTGEIDVGGTRISLRGVDDPHMHLDRYDEVAGRPDPGADLSIGLTHSPEPRVLDAMSADGVDLVLAGHTHGGQLCVPGFGALVTNCGLPASQASGLSRWGRSWLHVSAGLGTSPYTPFRFACPPSATLLTLVPAAPTGTPGAVDRARLDSAAANGV